MSEENALGTRAVSLTKEDLQDLRAQLSRGVFDVKERELVQYLTEQAEIGMEAADDTIPLWTWTYRF